MNSYICLLEISSSFNIQYIGEYRVIQSAGKVCSGVGLPPYPEQPHCGLYLFPRRFIEVSRF